MLEQTIWHPISSSKIFRSWPEIFDLDHPKWSYIDFFKYEAILVRREHCQGFSYEQIILLKSLLTAKSIRLILQIESADLRDLVLLKKIVSLELAINIRFNLASELLLDVGNLNVAWFTLQLTAMTNLNVMKVIDFESNGVPIFVEISREGALPPSSHSIEIAKAQYQFFENNGNLPHLFSLEEVLHVEQESFYWKNHSLIEYKYFDAKPDLSIIIPSHNRAKYLMPVLAAIQSQVDFNRWFEVIIIDDRSNDQTEESIREWIGQNSPKFNFRYFYITSDPLSKEKLNRVGAIRNFGAMNASANNFLFIDSDILLPKTFLSELFKMDFRNKVIQPYRADLNHKETQDLFGLNDFGAKALKHPGDFTSDASNFMKNQSPDADFVSWGASYCWCMTKESFITVGGFRNCFVTYGWEDLDLIFRLLYLKMSFVPSKQIVFHAYTLDDSSEYSEGVFHRRLMLAEGAEIFFRNTLSLRALKCMVFGFFRAIIILQKYRRYIEPNFKSSYLDSFSLDQIMNLGQVILPSVRYPQVFFETESPMKFLESVFPIDFTFKKLLILGDECCTLPTEILLKKEWGCQEIRRVLSDSNSYESDNFVNFIHLAGWKFKSGRIKDFNVHNSAISLILVNDKGESVESQFEFDCILIQNIELFEKLNVNAFKKGTRLFFLINIAQSTGFRRTLDNFSLGQKRFEYTDEQNFELIHLEI